MFEFNRNMIRKLYYFDGEQTQGVDISDDELDILDSFALFKDRKDLPNFVVNVTLEGSGDWNMTLSWMDVVTMFHPSLTVLERICEEIYSQRDRKCN